MADETGIREMRRESFVAARRAADEGDLDAAFKVGNMLARGEVGTRSPEELAEAERLWSAGARAGHVPSMLYLGHFYNSLAAQPDAVRAARHYLDVLARDDADAAVRAEARSAFKGLRLHLIAVGDAEACQLLGRWHLVGEVDHELAAPWLARAAMMRQG